MENIIRIANIVFYAMLGISLIFLLYKIFYHIFGLLPARTFKPTKNKYKYAIIVPARNESVVIRSLLKSIQRQSYDSELIDTYVIVESMDDPTVKICREFKNTFVFVRPNLDVKCKGAALDQCFKYILSEKKEYDAYFIFDADNILHPEFITEMNKVYDQGYDMALGYRNSKNWNDGWIASCSALVFSMVNTFQNKCRARFNQNVVVSGTGFYIKSTVIKQLGGWPFQTLTEDYEVSLYTTINGLHSTYCESAEYYDEQPKKLKVSWEQRMRWIRGYGQNTKNYSKKLFNSFLVSSENRWMKFDLGLNIIPIAVPLASVIIYILFMFCLGIIGFFAHLSMWEVALINAAITSLASWLFFFLYGIVLMLAERKHMKISAKNWIKTAFSFPFFLFLFIPIFINSLFKKEVQWVPIEHNVNPEEFE